MIDLVATVIALPLVLALTLFCCWGVVSSARKHRVALSHQPRGVSASLQGYVVLTFLAFVALGVILRPILGHPDDPSVEAFVGAQLFVAFAPFAVALCKVGRILGEPLKRYLGFLSLTMAIAAFLQLWVSLNWFAGIDVLPQLNSYLPAVPLTMVVLTEIDFLRRNGWRPYPQQTR